MATTENSTTRRAIIAGLAALPTIGIGAQVFAPNHSDALLLTAWNERQHALAEIESHGSFYSYQGRFNDSYDTAETRVHTIDAETPEGVLAKLWVAFSHMGGPVTGDGDRAQRDAIRRADLNEVGAFAEELDFDCHAMFEAIKCLTAIVGRQ